MAVRPESRWWIVTLALVGLLIGLSALALDRPDVVWADGKPYCPRCRSDVQAFSTRCGVCRDEFDWSAAPDEDSPISTFSLSPLEEQHLRARVEALGEGPASALVATELQLPPQAATAYLKAVGSGRCGWCGGTGRNLAPSSEGGEACPACFGRKACVACGGDRRVRVGDAGAARDVARYLQDVAALSRHLDMEVQRRELRRLAQAFLERHAGTLEAQRVRFPATWDPTSAEPQSTVRACRARLDRVLRALASG